MTEFRRVAYFVAGTALTVAFLVYVLRVEPRDLTGIVFILTFLSWVSFVVLGRAAYQRPRIGALTERTFIALVIAVLGTFSCVLALNTDAGRPLLDAATASLIFRLVIIAVLAVPAIWLALWFLGRLGPSGHG